MGIKGHFDHDHLMYYCKVIKVDNRLTICYRDKEDSSILDMYRDRARMHKVGYQHRVTKIIDRMMVCVYVFYIIFFCIIYTVNAQIGVSFCLLFFIYLCIMVQKIIVFY